MKTFVRMFQPRFARLVEARTKLQTVRPLPARRPEICDWIDAREWTGKPYRSKQRRILKAEIAQVSAIYLTPVGVRVDRSWVNRRDFAKADGFTGFQEMVDWFDEAHGLPFLGILIRWDPKTIEVMP